MKTALIGFMGAGKTTAVRTIGDRALDVDEVIEARAGRRVQDIFATDGEAAFRELEERVTLELLDDPAASVLAQAYRQKFGGDHIDDVKLALAAYEERIGWQR